MYKRLTGREVKFEFPQTESADDGPIRVFPPEDNKDADHPESPGTNNSDDDEYEEREGSNSLRVVRDEGGQYGH